jgi:hypothetical protein
LSVSANRSALFDLFCSVCYIIPMTLTDSFDWGSRGEQFYRDLAKSAGVRSELCLRFFVAKLDSCSNTEAARRAGAGGNPANSGYRLSRSRDLERLYATMTAETGTEVGLVDRAESKRILSAMVRSSDPSVKIRAVELLSKLEQQDREQAALEGSDPFKEMRILAETNPELAYAVARHFNWEWERPLMGGEDFITLRERMFRLRREAWDIHKLLNKLANNNTNTIEMAGAEPQPGDQPEQYKYGWRPAENGEASGV